MCRLTCWDIKADPVERFWWILYTSAGFLSENCWVTGKCYYHAALWKGKVNNVWMCYVSHASHLRASWKKMYMRYWEPSCLQPFVPVRLFPETCRCVSWRQTNHQLWEWSSRRDGLPKPYWGRHEHSRTMFEVFQHKHHMYPFPLIPSGRKLCVLGESFRNVCASVWCSVVPSRLPELRGACMEASQQWNTYSTSSL